MESYVEPRLKYAFALLQRQKQTQQQRERGWKR